MSNCYYYRLHGESKQSALNFAAKQHEQRKALQEYLSSTWGVGIGDRYRIQGIHFKSLRAIPIKGEIPPHFKRERDDYRLMSPRISTKAGRALEREWRKIGVEVSDSKLLEQLGLETEQICSDGRHMMEPYTMILNENAYLVSACPCKHSEAEEVTQGYIDSEIESHNAKVKEATNA